VKKIGIFTADLMTPAGPSRAACWIAERLSRRHEVWLISRDRPAIQSLIRRFGVSLADVRFLSLDVPGDRRASAWRSLTPSVLRRYWSIVNQFPAYRRLCNLKLDLFILNQSFHYMKNPAPRGIFMCMFPWPLPQFPHARWCRLPLVKPLINRALANTLNRFPDAPETYDVITANSHFTALDQAALEQGRTRHLLGDRADAIAAVRSEGAHHPDRRAIQLGQTAAHPHRGVSGHAGAA
jgi:hypothetical protein